MAVILENPQTSLLIADAPVPYKPEEFAAFCARYPELRAELTAEGEMLIMPPAGDESSGRNAELTTEVVLWNRETRLGTVFDSSAGFTLPSGAIRSPDTAWVERTRWQGLPLEQRNRFAPICPDFVAELRSDSDRLSDVQDKMVEYRDNGARLGWLIDPARRRAEIYRLGQDVEVLDNPATVSGDDVLPGFTLDLTHIWT